MREIDKKVILMKNKIRSTETKESLGRRHTRGIFFMSCGSERYHRPPPVGEKKVKHY